ncbi:S1C family serine protease [Bacillus sp. FJAT-27445]|uniref:S1C family serine protease n=1 Tax=Bacillus sp. FJAT-27445 TaxID=1679166 RepID=UPI0007441F56|nr:trypsin-like peptidase domain-containing protein [Bacillus sp. FJAT-27445]
MSDFYQDYPQIQPQPEPEKKPAKSGKLKSFLSTISAGVIGSALTLATVNYTDIGSNLGLDNQGAAQTESSGSPTNLVPASTASRSETGSIADMVEKSSKAIVGIVNLQPQNNPFNDKQGIVERGSGSGVLFKKDGNTAYIVTNNHVIEGAEKLEVSFYDGQKATAQVVGADALTDLAVIKVDAKYVTQTLEFADSSSLRPGDEVFAIGNPLGQDLSRTVTRGIVSAINRSIDVKTSAGEWKLDVIQTDAAINPGNSGGALINTEGQLVGINSLKISESGVEGLGFAIPSNNVVPIVNEMIKTGKVERPYLGVSLADFEEIHPAFLQDLPKGVDSGTMVTLVQPGSGADKAGVQKQDVIVSIDGKKVENSSDLRRYLYSGAKAGDKVKLKIYRDGKERTIEVTLSGNNVTS